MTSGTPLNTREGQTMMECRCDCEDRENSVRVFEAFSFERLCEDVCVGELVSELGILNGGTVKLGKHAVGTFQLSKTRELCGN
jgi:hypothetical protein